MAEARKKRILNSKKAEPFIAELKDMGLDFSVRNGSECIEVILDDTQYYFARRGVFPRRKIYLFNTVKMSAEKYLKKNTVVLPKPKPKSILFNYDYDADKGILTGTDLNHAYWRIAYVNGIISEKTYVSGLIGKTKELRLATLSVLGREKRFDEYVNGVKEKSVVYQEKNEELNNVFRFIRETCWKHMENLSKLLGDDFYSYRVDCIYYRDTKKNVEIAQKYFDDNNLTYKQLVY